MCVAGLRTDYDFIRFDGLFEPTHMQGVQNVKCVSVITYFTYPINTVKFIAINNEILSASGGCPHTPASHGPILWANIQQ